MARAKQTNRAEARRRYRQVNADSADDQAAELDPGERRTDSPSGKPSAPNARDARSPTGRIGFGAAFRGAYRPANVREDLRHLPMLLRSRAFLAGLLLVLGGAVALYFFPAYTGSQFIWQLVVLPQSALAPQLVVGFFAPRASYILGFLMGVTQTIAYSVLLSTDRVRAALEAIQPGASPVLRADEVLFGMVSASLMGALLAAMAAWYRRFLAMSSPRRAPAGRGPSGRQPAKGNPSRRPAGR